MKGNKHGNDAWTTRRMANNFENSRLGVAYSNCASCCVCYQLRSFSWSHDDLAYNGLGIFEVA